MKFQEQQRPDYPEVNKWLVSGNEAFAIGVYDYLYGRKCIQVLHRDVLDGKWWVVREWATYEPELAGILVRRIEDGLAELEATFGEWRKVEGCLPPKEARYLEDEPALSTKFELDQMVLPKGDLVFPGVPSGTQGRIVKKKWCHGGGMYDVRFIVRKAVVVRVHGSEMELVFEVIPPWTYTVPVKDLALKLRTLNTLRRAGLRSMGETLEEFQKGYKEMLKIPNFGQKSLDELKRALEGRLRRGK